MLFHRKASLYGKDSNVVAGKSEMEELMVYGTAHGITKKIGEAVADASKQARIEVGISARKT